MQRSARILFGIRPILRTSHQIVDEEKRQIELLKRKNLETKKKKGRKKDEFFLYKNIKFKKKVKIIKKKYL